VTNILDAKTALVAEGRAFYQKGWMLGTSGNLSVRVDDGLGELRAAITASGIDKGRLEIDDILILNEQMEIVGEANGRRPSAETSIHWAIYRSDPTIKAIFHVHTVATTMASTLVDTSVGQALEISGLEMVKGFDLWNAGAIAQIPVLPNHHHVPHIASDSESLLQGDAPLPAFLIQGHGMTAWGKSVSQARKHLEICEFLCACAWEAKRP
jgi:methylthioribulose-1-phosphate dehydratase